MKLLRFNKCKNKTKTLISKPLINPLTQPTNKPYGSLPPHPNVHWFNLAGGSSNQIPPYLLLPLLLTQPLFINHPGMRGVPKNTKFLQTTQEYVWYKKWPSCYTRQAELTAKGPKPDEVFPLPAAAAVVSSGLFAGAGAEQL